MLTLHNKNNKLHNMPAKSYGKCFIVGLPRSGSTLLSRLLNESPQILSLNDLYYLQLCDQLDAFSGKLNKAKFNALSDWLLGVIRTRGLVNNEFIGGFAVNEQKLHEIENDLKSDLERPLAWYELLDMILSRLAIQHGADIWIDKTPQNFWFLSKILEAFPNAKIIFLMRHPFDVMSSFKFASGEGHDARRYHPIVYSQYWKKAAVAYKKAKSEANVLLIKYEDIINNYGCEMEKIANYLDIEIKDVDICNIGDNSSFTGQRKMIYPLERNICRLISGSQMTELGYEKGAFEPITLACIYNLISQTIIFALFQIRRIIFDSNGRKRILRFLFK